MRNVLSAQHSLPNCIDKNVPHYLPLYLQEALEYPTLLTGTFTSASLATSYIPALLFLSMSFFDFLCRVVFIVTPGLYCSQLDCYRPCTLLWTKATAKLLNVTPLDPYVRTGKNSNGQCFESIVFFRVTSCHPKRPDGSMVSWLALWTLNPAIRAQISVEPRIVN